MNLLFQRTKQENYFLFRNLSYIVFETKQNKYKLKFISTMNYNTKYHFSEIRFLAQHFILKHLSNQTKKIKNKDFFFFSFGVSTIRFTTSFHIYFDGRLILLPIFFKSINLGCNFASRRSVILGDERLFFHFFFSNGDYIIPRSTRFMSL